jgi:hypothetical protein
MNCLAHAAPNFAHFPPFAFLRPRPVGAHPIIQASLSFRAWVIHRLAQCNAHRPSATHSDCILHPRAEIDKGCISARRSVRRLRHGLGSWHCKPEESHTTLCTVWSRDNRWPSSSELLNPEKPSLLRYSPVLALLLLLLSLLLSLLLLLLPVRILLHAQTRRPACLLVCPEPLSGASFES